MKRYGVARSDEGGTLFRNDGTPIDHTWDVIDRMRIRDDGYPESVSNHDTRKLARAEAKKMNDEEAARLKASPLDPNPGTFGVSPGGR